VTNNITKPITDLIFKVIEPALQ